MKAIDKLKRLQELEDIISDCHSTLCDDKVHLSKRVKRILTDNILNYQMQYRKISGFYYTPVKNRNI